MKLDVLKANLLTNRHSCEAFSTAEGLSSAPLSGVDPCLGAEGFAAQGEVSPDSQPRFEISTCRTVIPAFASMTVGGLDTADGDLGQVHRCRSRRAASALEGTGDSVQPLWGLADRSDGSQRDILHAVAAKGAVHAQGILMLTTSLRRPAWPERWHAISVKG